MIVNYILVFGVYQLQLIMPTFGSENASDIKDVKNKSAAFRLPARWSNFSLKSHIMKIWPNKASLAQIIKKIPVLNGKNQLKICICDPNVRPCCPQMPVSMVLSRQSELAKTNGSQKTYLDQIVDRERQFSKTSVNSNAATHSTPLGKSCPTIKDESSTVFKGSIECPLDKKRIEYSLWIRPNKKKRTALCVHKKRLKTKKPPETVQVNTME